MSLIISEFLADMLVSMAERIRLKTFVLIERPTDEQKMHIVTEMKQLTDKLGRDPIFDIEDFN